jgi:hypothetical protein
MMGFGTEGRTVAGQFSPAVSEMTGPTAPVALIGSPGKESTDELPAVQLLYDQAVRI